MIFFLIQYFPNDDYDIKFCKLSRQSAGNLTLKVGQYQCSSDLKYHSKENDSVSPEGYFR